MILGSIAAALSLAIPLASPPPPPIVPKAAQLPYATLQGRTISLQPSGARFDLPASWLDWYNQFHNNLRLRREEIESAKTGDTADWDPEYAAVVNAVLPFDACAVHAGGEGWGAQAVAYSDVQMRAYVVSWTPKHLLSRVETAGMRQASGPMKVSGYRFSKSPPTLERGEEEGWSRRTIRFTIRYDDYGATAIMDFYARAFGNRTVALVFMHTNFPAQQKEEIQEVLHSFAWTPGETAKRKL